MRLIWTRNSMPLSKLIRWGLKEPVSHFAICFDEFLVFHSNLWGVHLQSLEAFEKQSEIIFSIKFDLTGEQEEAIYKKLIPLYDGRGYDLGALAYFMIAGFKQRFFGILMPEKNPWGKENLELCTEMIVALPDDVVPARVKADLGELDIVSPYAVYQRLVGAGLANG